MFPATLASLMSLYSSSHADAVIQALDSAELVFLFDHLIRVIPAHRVGFWLSGASGDELLLARDRALGRWVDHASVPSVPLSEGLVSKTFREGSTELDDGMYRRKEGSARVDQSLHQITACQISVPVVLAGERVGVLSAVQLANEGAPAPGRWGFTDGSQQTMEGFAKVFEGLISRHVK
jgi:hypothetical protein